jgi:hypothetical protein
VANRARSLQPLGSRLDSALEFARRGGPFPVSRSELFGAAYHEQLAVINSPGRSEDEEADARLQSADPGGTVTGSAHDTQQEALQPPSCPLEALTERSSGSGGKHDNIEDSSASSETQYVSQTPGTSFLCSALLGSD